MQQLLVNLRGARDPAAAVEEHLAIGLVRDQSIDDHVARSYVEGDHVGTFRAGRNHADIGDTADIERDAIALGRTEQQVVDVGNQRRAFASGRDIALAEVGNDPHTGALRYYGRFADLEGAGDAMAEAFNRVAFVEDGLAVHPADANGIGRDMRATASVEHGFRIQFAEQEAEARDGSCMRHRVRHAEQRGSNGRRIGSAAECDRGDLEAVAPVRDIHDCYVDPIERRAAHNSDGLHARLSSFCSSDSN